MRIDPNISFEDLEFIKDDSMPLRWIEAYTQFSSREKGVNHYYNLNLAEGMCIDFKSLYNLDASVIDYSYDHDHSDSLQAWAIVIDFDNEADEAEFILKYQMRAKNIMCKFLKIHDKPRTWISSETYQTFHTIANFAEWAAWGFHRKFPSATISETTGNLKAQFNYDNTVNYFIDDSLNNFSRVRIILTFNNDEDEAEFIMKMS